MKDFLNALWKRIQREPAVLLSLLGAGFAMFTSFGLELDKEQVGTITAFVVVVLGFLTRSQVTPTKSVAAEEAHPGDGGPDVELVAGPAAEVITGAPVDVVATRDPRAYEDESDGL